MTNLSSLKHSFRWELMGYGLYRVWILQHLMYARYVAEPAGITLLILYGALALAGFLSIVIWKHIRTIEQAEFARGITLFACLLGSFCAVLGMLLDQRVYSVLGMIFVGFGGYIEVRWCSYFSGLDKNGVYCNILLSILITSICGLVMNMFIPAEAFFFETTLLFLGNAALFFTAQKRIGCFDIERLSLPAEVGQPQRQSTAGVHPIPGILGRIVLTCVLYDIVHISATTIGYVTSPEFAGYDIRHAANLVAVIALLLIFLTRGSVSTIGLCKTILPITAAGLFMQLISIDQLGRIAFFTLCFGNKLFEIMMLILVVELASSLLLSPSLGFGALVAAKNGGALIGTILSSTALAWIDSNGHDITMLIATLVMLLIVTLLWVFSGKTFFEPLRDTMSVKPQPKAEPLTITAVSSQLAQTYSLTERETAVLLLLARGKNKSAIAEELTVSQSTAHTHIIHVYRKLGVHDQQELIKLVEQTQAQAGC